MARREAQASWRACAFSAGRVKDVVGSMSFSSFGRFSCMF